MAPRDYTSSPVADGLGLHEVCLGLSQDLADLRGGKISPQEALARAALARQLFNGCRLYLQAIKTMEGRATPVGGAMRNAPLVGVQDHE
ncbi:hypothetical protein CDV52_19620 [Haematobacter missouriensis]|uniref:Uncharacterized protein n=1 Tax=Haematobacter missouriensis TaxID=366616 RepID=A0A212AHW6_9RHOB|nr:hypothetical protein [Haematobacter missouriensis]OWJ81091.1 hypothetical protein CDV52_19620 [Haematobacter missouriensis]